MTLIAIAALGLLYVLVPIVAHTFARYRGARRLRCPETGDEARVQIDARHAAPTAIPGPPELRVEACSLWPERAGCEQSCARPGVSFVRDHAPDLMRAVKVPLR